MLFCIHLFLVYFVGFKFRTVSKIVVCMMPAAFGLIRLMLNLNAMYFTKDIFSEMD